MINSSEIEVFVDRDYFFRYFSPVIPRIGERILALPDKLSHGNKCVSARVTQVEHQLTYKKLDSYGGATLTPYVIQVMATTKPKKGEKV